MTAMEETMLRAPRQRPGRAAPGRRAGRAGQAAGRHERRVRLVEAVEQPVRATRASRHAARTGWVELAHRLVGQARAWWAVGTERVPARRRSTDGPAPTPAAAVAPGPVVGPVRATGGRPAAAGTSARTAERTSAAARSFARTGGHTATPVGTSARTAGRTSAAAGVPTPRHLAAVARRASWGEDLVTGWCAALLVLGLYLDGAPTAWHGLLYLGFGVTAWWILTREQRPGSWSLRAVPAGYRLALAGVGLGLVAVAGDTVWHALVGTEQGMGRLVSPVHLVLFAGVCLLGSSALRAAWSGPSPARVPGLKALWPVVLSTTLVVAVTAFFFQDVSPQATATAQVSGLLLHNLLFIAPVLWLLLRWETPLGTFTVMAGSVAVALATQTGLGLVGLAGAAVLGGTAADVAVALLRPSPQRRWAARAAAVIAPAVYWTAHFALLKVGYGASLEPALWLGSVLWACLSGFTLALLMWPPAVPLTAWNRGRTRPPSTATPTAMPARMVGR
jgi:hypothetical protein